MTGQCRIKIHQQRFLYRNAAFPVWVLQSVGLREIGYWRSASWCNSVRVVQLTDQMRDFMASLFIFILPLAEHLFCEDLPSFSFGAVPFLFCFPFLSAIIHN
jgi:hypothetical protein